MPSTNVRASGNFDDLNRSIQNTAKMVADLGLKLSGIQAAGKAFDVVTSTINGTINALGKVGQAAIGIEAIGKSAVAMGMGLLQGNAALEMTTISFKTLLGSGQAAQDMIKTLTDFAAHTPFELSGLEANTQRLLAFGFGAKDIIPLMTSMGDAIAALGGTQDNLNSLVYVMGQMRSEAHLNAGDIMQMTNLGIPALKMLADHYKVTTGEMQNMISKGLVPGQEAVQIFTTSLETQYGGMMAAQSATFSGMISNLQDWAAATTITLTKPLFQPAKDALQAFLDYVQSPAGQAAVTKLADYIQAGVDRLTTSFNEIMPKVKPGLDSFLQTMEPIATKALEIYKAISPLNIALDTLRGILTGGLAGGFDALEQHVIDLGHAFGIDLNPVFDWINNFIQNTLAPGIKTFAENVLPKIGDAAKWVVDRLGDFSNFISVNVWPTAKKVFEWIGDKGTDLFNAVANTLKTTVFPAIEKFGNWISTWLWPRLQDVFGWIGEHVGPILDGAFTVLNDHIIPWLGTMVDTILNHIIPTLTSWWTVLVSLVQPGLEMIGQIISEIILPAFGLLTDSANGNAVSMGSLADVVNDKVIPVFQTATGIVHGLWTAMGGWAVEGTINGLSQIFDKVSGDKAVLKDLTTASDEFKKKNDEVNKQLSGNGSSALDQTISKMREYGNQLTSGTLFTTLFNNSQNDAANKLNALSMSAISTAKAKLDELQKEYQTGQISQQDYQKAVEDVTKRLDDYQKGIATATQQLKEGKTPVDNYKQSVTDLMTVLMGKSANTMTGAKDQIDSLTKKYLDGKGTLQDWQDAMDALASHLDKNGRDAIINNEGKIDDLSQKYKDGKISLDDYKKGFNDIILQMQNEGKTFQEKAKDRQDDLNKKFWDGKISFQDYKLAMDQVNQALDTYNNKQIAQKKLTANFDEFIGQIANVATKLAQLQPPAWLSNMTAAQQGAFWQSVSSGAPNYNPPPVYGHAAGTSNAPGGLSLVGEKGMELIRMATSGALMLATRPMLLNLPKGSQVFNNQQTVKMLPNPASAAQISNMYATNYANRSWDYSTNQSNSNNTTNYYVNGQQGNQWSFGQQMRWNVAR